MKLGWLKAQVLPVIAAVVVLYLATNLLGRFVPASWWFEVQSVYIHNTKVGEAPEMDIDRAIHRTFRGAWVAEVQRRNSFGGYSVYCTGHGRNEYEPGDKLPPKVDLNWWTHPVVCELEPGTYRVVTVWRFATDGFGNKVVRNTSNDFEVFAK